MAHQDCAATINRPNQSSTYSIHNRLKGRVRSNHNCSRAVGSRPNTAAATVSGIAVAVKPATTAAAADYSNCSVCSRRTNERPHAQATPKLAWAAATAATEAENGTADIIAGKTMVVAQADSCLSSKAKTLKSHWKITTTHTTRRTWHHSDSTLHRGGLTFKMCSSPF